MLKDEIQEITLRHAPEPRVNGAPEVCQGLDVGHHVLRLQGNGLQVQVREACSVLHHQPLQLRQGRQGWPETQVAMREDDGVELDAGQVAQRTKWQQRRAHDRIAAVPAGADADALQLWACRRNGVHVAQGDGLRGMVWSWSQGAKHQHRLTNPLPSAHNLLGSRMRAHTAAPVSAALLLLALLA